MPCKVIPAGRKALKPSIGRNALDSPMALLDGIVQIFALTNFDGLTGFFLERPACRGKQ
jgi:hypothetical protein